MVVSVVQGDFGLCGLRWDYQAISEGSELTLVEDQLWRTHFDSALRAVSLFMQYVLFDGSLHYLCKKKMRFNKG